MINYNKNNIIFLFFALLFIFDLEILLIYPYSVSAYTNETYGLITMLIFFLILTAGFAFELGKNALNIDSRQLLSVLKKWIKTIISISGIKLLNWSVYFLYSILFFFSFIIYSTIIVIILFKKGLIDLSFLHNYSDIFLPLYMNSEPLDFYPEYKQINNLQEIFSVKQHLFNIKKI